MTSLPHNDSSWVGPKHREGVLESAPNTAYDVVVIGAGITGAGVAVDAASRGLRTLLVDRVDIAAGTSRWSSKLVHGGLRYLAKGDITIAWESAAERHHVLTTIAPHLTHPVATVVPLNDDVPATMGALTEVGIRFADVLRALNRTPSSVLPTPRRLSSAETMSYVPGLKRDGLRGGLCYWDGQIEDDARLVTELVRTAASYGADILLGYGAESIGESSATLVDSAGQRLDVTAGAVVNATGVWVGDLEPLLSITPSRGSHIVVPTDALGGHTAVITVPIPGHFGRYVIAMPQPDGLTYIGLTDEDAPGVDGIAPPVPDDDVTFLLDVVNRALATPLTSSDVIGQFAGLRPLIGVGGGNTADASRKHVLIDEPGRPISIAGGKLTTYRVMAEQAVDAAVRRTGRDVHEYPCRTKTLPLVGAFTSPASCGSDEVAGRPGSAPERLVRRYGRYADQVWQLRHSVEVPGVDLGEPVVDGRPVLGVEFAFGVLAEGAQKVDDLVERRTRLGLINGAAEVAEETAQKIIDALV